MPTLENNPAQRRLVCACVFGETLMCIILSGWFVISDLLVCINCLTQGRIIWSFFQLPFLKIETKGRKENCYSFPFSCAVLPRKEGKALRPRPLAAQGQRRIEVLATQGLFLYNASCIRHASRQGRQHMGVEDFKEKVEPPQNSAPTMCVRSSVAGLCVCFFKSQGCY